MGFFSAIGNFVRRLFGIKPKSTEEESTNKPTEESKVELDDFGKKGYTEEEMIDRGYEKSIIHRDTKKTVLPSKREVSIKNYENRLKTRPSFKYLSKEEIGQWEDAINPNKRVIQTGYYGSEESLTNSKYEIYRNFILKAIKDDKVVQEIYRSGILDEHIVCFLKLKLKDSTRKKISEVTYEVQGLTPDKVLKYGVFNRLIGFSGNNYEIDTKVNEVCEINARSITQSNADSESTIIDVQVSFNYA